MTQGKSEIKFRGLKSVWCALKRRFVSGKDTIFEKNKILSEQDDVSFGRKICERERPFLTAEEAYGRAERRMMTIGMMRGECRPLERRNIMEDYFDGI